MSFFKFITQDFRHAAKLGDSVNRLSVQGAALVLFRVSQRMGGRFPILGSSVKAINHLLTGVDIAWQCQIGPGLRLFHPTGVVIGAGVTIGSNCWIQSSTTVGGRGASADGNPTLGDNVLVSTGARILGNISVGNNSRIGANAVVIRNVPAGATAVGVPARNLMKQ